MRWIPVLAIALLGCEPKPEPALAPLPVVAAPPKARSAAPVEQVPSPPPPTAEPAATTPAPAAAGPHPGEPANPAELFGITERYFDRVGSTPQNWQDLIRNKVLRSVPVGRNGKPLDYMQFRDWEATRGKK